jgi:hypothetical protein
LLTVNYSCHPSVKASSPAAFSFFHPAVCQGKFPFAVLFPLSTTRNVPTALWLSHALLNGILLAGVRKHPDCRRPAQRVLLRFLTSWSPSEYKVHTEVRVNPARLDSVLRLTLVVGFLCLTTPLAPSDLQPTLRYTTGHATPQAHAIFAACYCEDNACSPDDVVPQERACSALFLPSLLSLSLPVGAAPSPARPPVLVALHAFPRKLSPRSALDEPFLS